MGGREALICRERNSENNELTVCQVPQHTVDMLVEILSHLVDIFSAAKCDSAGGPGRRWIAGASQLDQDAREHSLPDSSLALDTPTGDTTTTC